MPASKLAVALSQVDWQGNIKAFVQDAASVNVIVDANVRLAVWARQFETHDRGNASLCFVREMQAASHHVAALTALALYKPSAAAMRAMMETALYYSYFRSHPSELATLVRDPDFFISKADVLEYHKRHTPDFGKLQQRLGLVSGISKWYGFVSSVVHGQIPGKWSDHRSLAEIKYRKPTVEVVARTFREGEELVHRLFLCTVGRELWDTFSTPAKQHLILGLPGPLRAALGIDSA
jgi:hypothetical protein